MSWMDIGALADVPVRGARMVKTQGGCVAVFRTGPEEVFATADRCPHKGGPLSEGIVHGTRVTCPLHNRVFSLESGEAQGADEGRIATYPIRIENGRLMLDTAALAAREPA
ncbi:MAG: nitrite reductase small subunit NirD [Maritimibacter sp.]|nr:nitrite reductase small subunit NirD [Maritimibacter sp.]